MTTRRRIKKQTDKRQVLLSAAHQVFDRCGYTGTTVNDIIEEAKVSRATFYGYFSDKDDIFVAVVLQVLEQLGREMGLPGASGRRLRPHTTDPALLRRQVVERVTIYFLQWEKETALMWGMLSLRVQAPERAMPILKASRQSLAEAARWVRYDQEAGRLNTRVDADVALEALQSMIEGFAFRYYGLRSSNAPSLSPQELAEQVTAIWFEGVYRTATA